MSIDLIVDGGYTSADSRGCPKMFPTLANTWKQSPKLSRAKPEKRFVQGEVFETSTTQRAQQTIKKIKIGKNGKIWQNMLFQLNPPSTHKYYIGGLSVWAGGARSVGQEGMVSGTAVGGATYSKGVVRTPLLVSRIIPTKNTTPRNTAMNSS